MTGDKLYSLDQRCVHVCVDMQRLFAEQGDWFTPAMNNIVPAVERLAAHNPRHTLFTRLVTPFEAEQANGCWADFYRRWPGVLLPALGSAKLEPVTSLRSMAKAGQVTDKTTYSAFNDGPFAVCLARAQAETLIVSDVETETSVLATVLDAVDRGYRVVLASDAIASSDPASHEATLGLLSRRFDAQVGVATSAQIIASWSAACDT